MSELREYKVYAIKEGTVIDHIPHGLGMKIVEMLGVENEGGIVTIGMNFESRKMGLKDIVKIENKKLSSEEFSKIALIAPNATINIIHGAGVVEKMPLKLPEMVRNLIKCSNPMCITNAETVCTKFYVKINGSYGGIRVKCHYCERMFDVNKMKLL